jgi:hypothetical protein
VRQDSRALVGQERAYSLGKQFVCQTFGPRSTTRSS